MFNWKVARTSVEGTSPGTAVLGGCEADP